MPVAVLADGEISIYYEDSGAPYGRDLYTTIVLVHGLSVNGSEYRGVDRII